MSWLYSQALAEEYLGENFLGGKQCALLNGTPTQLPSWCNDKTIKRCNLSQSGMTFKPLTDDLGGAVLMSYLEAFPVRTSVALGKEQASKESDHPCGRTWQELSVKYDQDTSLWKTHQCLWEEDLPESSVTLMKWGRMTPDGVLWERTTSGLPTSETESGSLESWRSPAANEPGITVDRLETANGEPVGSNCRHYDKETGRMAQIGLSQQVAAKERWPTPRAQEAKHGEPTDWEMQTEHEGTKHSLRVQVAKREQKWPTPSANEDAAGTPDGKMQWMLSHAARSGCSTRLKYEKQKWPTPTVQDSDKATKKWRENHQNNLTAAAFNPDKIYPTPTARDFKGGYKTESLTRKDGKSRANDALPNAVIDGKGVETVTGHLNPDWVEWLMGWPVGWTSMEKITELDWRDWSVDPASELQPRGTNTEGLIPTPSASETGFRNKNYAQGGQSIGVAIRKLGVGEGSVPRVTSERKHRVGRLKAIGNGQCPQAAALAWKILTHNSRGVGE